jgi:hypothetical protein
VTLILTLLAGAGLWLLLQLVEHLLSDALLIVFGPVLRPMGRAAGRLPSGTAAALLWMVALGSYAAWAAFHDVPSPALRTAAFVAFMAATPLAVIATLTLRERRQAAAMRPGRHRPTL